MEIEYVDLEKMNYRNRLAKYNSLTVSEKQDLLEQLKQDMSRLQIRIKEKQDIIDYLG